MDRPGSRRRIGVRAWLIVVAAAALTACQGWSQQPRRVDAPDSAVPSWRVVERLGAARYLSPSMAGWEQVVAGGILPAGSQISTGIGGRLIVSQAANQLSAGTNSRFILPERGGNVRQTAGWLRYRIAGASSASFGIETPFLDLVVGEAVLDVTVADGETEVAVVSGRVHVKTLDDRRQIDLHAGYVGYASLHGTPLAFRRGPDLALETVPVTVMPALHPGRPAAATAAPDPVAIAAPVVEGNPPGMPEAPRASASAQPVMVPLSAKAAPTTLVLANDRAQRANATGNRSRRASTATAPGAPADPAGAAGPAPATVQAMASPVAPAMPTAVEPYPETLEASLGAAAPQAPQSAAEPDEPRESRPQEPLRRRFDRLTENLLDGLSPAPPQALRGSWR